MPAIYRLADTTNTSLAISLHAPYDELRNTLVPINFKYPISKLLDACKYYLTAGSQKRHILIEYVMLKDINDSIDCAHILAKLLIGISVKVNLIPFNTFYDTKYIVSDDFTIDKFQNILRNKGIITTIRKRRGDDIVAACGQLVGDFDIN